MTRARLVAVDVPGLNLLLGGGVPVLKRHSESDESAVLLVRGPPGSGKTVLGTQLAGALARAIIPGHMMDIAYGCVELLPAELAAQHAGLHASGLPERVILPPFPVDAPEPHTGGECRIYADLLELEPGDEQGGIETAVERLLSLTERAGGKPRVVVIDSLSDGYNLGSQAPRILADALSKLAAVKGMVFILLEETIDSRPSHWSFAADLVVELGRPTEQGPDMRVKTINITKNRFGRAEAGPHSAAIAQGGRYTVWPDPSAYVSGFWNPPSRVRNGRQLRDWGVQQLDQQKDKWQRLGNQTVAVIGARSAEVRKFAYSLAVPIDKEVSLSVNISDAAKGPADVHIVDPYESGARFLSFILERVLNLASQQTLARVVLGDTRSLRLFYAKEDLFRALVILSTLLREANVPLILYDSSGPLFSDRAPDGNELPLIADFADVQIVGWTESAQRSSSIIARQGANHRLQWGGVL